MLVWLADSPFQVPAPGVKKVLRVIIKAQSWDFIPLGLTDKTDKRLEGFEIWNSTPLGPTDEPLENLKGAVLGVGVGPAVNVAPGGGGIGVHGHLEALNESVISRSRKCLTQVGTY